MTQQAAQQTDKNPVVLFGMFLQQYRSMLNTVIEMPIEKEMKDKIIFFVDTGFLWFKEAMNMIEYNSKLQAKQAEQAQASVDTEIRIDAPVETE